MKLTDEQKRMLDGQSGELVRQSMELIVEIGKFWDAPELIPVRSVHMSGASVKTARRAGKKYICWAAEQKKEFVTTTTINPASADLAGFDMGITPETMKQQLELTDAYRRMGAVECHTCTPYLIGNLPRKGESVAWGESSAVVFCNSVLGGRTNREGGPSGLASALTGFTPKFGMHLDENRRATVHALVEYPLGDVSDFGCIGYYVARNFPDAIPVYTGFPPQCPTYGLKGIAAALATSGSVSMYHAVGITPEASTLEAATGGKKVETIRIGSQEIEETKRFLNRTNTSSEVDCVFMGCPHFDYEEVRLAAKLLKGRKVHPNVALWLFSSNSVWRNCERSGLTDVLKNAGAAVISDTCPSITIMREIMASRGFKSAATNSSKLAHYIPSSWGLNIHYGSTEEMIEAAITGKWRG